MDAMLYVNGSGFKEQAIGVVREIGILIHDIAKDASISDQVKVAALEAYKECVTHGVKMDTRIDSCNFTSGKAPKIRG